MQEKCREHHQELVAVFIDLTKAFDSVNRSGLKGVLAKVGYPDKVIRLIQLFHDGMAFSVVDNGSMSKPFSVTNGTKQGCVLAPLLFSIFFATML